MTQPVSGLRAGVNAASKSPQSTVAKSDCNTGLHDGMADPEVYKHVEISKQLATLLEVASADQVCAAWSTLSSCCEYADMQDRD